MYELKQIHTSIENLITAVSNSIKVELAVFDREAELICCTPTYLKKKGTTVHAPSIEEVLKNGSVLVQTPGKTPVCEGCRFKDNCPSTEEILCCIKAAEQVVGVVAITAFTKEGRQRILSNTLIYLNAIKEIADLIGELVLNKTGYSTASKINNLIQGAMEITDSPMLISDKNGVITQYNDLARNTFDFCELTAASLWQIFPRHLVFQLLQGEEHKEKEEDFGKFTAKITSKIVSSENEAYTILIKVTHIAEASSSSTKGKNVIIGNGERMKSIKNLVRKLSNSPTPVLITGETGTGKELIARALHEEGHRSRQPFVAINCSSIPENLFESELFGYEEGAFTGARKGGKPGKIEMAQGGTLFLDELGAMPLAAQPKLLRVLQEYEIERVGSSYKIPLDIRVIAATNESIERMVGEKTFRDDLYYRIAVINVDLPPLRHRREDIIPIAEYYLEKLKARLETPVIGFDSQVKEFFMTFDWPGNIRQLQNVVEYGANLCETSLMTMEDLPEMLTQNMEHREMQKSKIPSPELPLIKQCTAPRKYSSAEEEDEIRRLLSAYGYTLEGKKKIAEVLGISVRTLYRKLQRMEIN